MQSLGIARPRRPSVQPVRISMGVVMIFALVVAGGLWLARKVDAINEKFSEALEYVKATPDDFEGAINRFQEVRRNASTFHLADTEARADKIINALRVDAINQKFSDAFAYAKAKPEDFEGIIKRFQEVRGSASASNLKELGARADKIINELQTEMSIKKKFSDAVDYAEAHPGDLDGAMKRFQQVRELASASHLKVIEERASEVISLIKKVREESATLRTVQCPYCSNRLTVDVRVSTEFTCPYCQRVFSVR